VVDKQDRNRGPGSPDAPLGRVPRPGARRRGRSGTVSAAEPSGLQAALIRFSIHFRGVVVALACIMLGYGTYILLQRSKFDVFPEFAPPQVTIQTVAPGLSPEQVEVLVTQPLENVVNGTPGVSSLRSASIQGLSVITVIFDPASDIYRDRQLMELRTMADWTIRPRLLAVPGVAKVAIFGGDSKSLQVQVDPDQLRYLSLCWICSSDKKPVRHLMPGAMGSFRKRRWNSALPVVDVT